MGRGVAYPLYIIAIEFSLLTAGFLLNLLGVICSSKQRNSNRTRRATFINLSVVEMMTAVIIMFITLWQQYPPLALLLRKHKIVTRVLIMLYHVITFELFNVMTFITLDRLASALYPIKYKIHMNQSTARKIIAATWMTSFCVAFPFIFPPISIQLYGLHYSSYVMQGVFLISTVVAYGCIARILVKRKTSSVGQSQTSVKKVRWLGGMKCKVPFVITSSFFGLLVVPNLLKEVVRVQNIYVQVTVEIMSYLVLILDPIIYLFSSQSLRSVAFKLFDCNILCSTMKRCQSDCVRRNDNTHTGHGHEVSHELDDTQCYYLAVPRRPRTDTERSDDTICSEM